MKIEIQRMLFSLIITFLVYLLCKKVGVNPFLIGWWCMIIFNLSSDIIYFLIFPHHQKYVIRFTNKSNFLLHEWLTSLNPDDDTVKSKKKEKALRFDTEQEAREVLTSLLCNKGPWESSFNIDVKKYYS